LMDFDLKNLFCKKLIVRDFRRLNEKFENQMHIDVLIF